MENDMDRSLWNVPIGGRVIVYMREHKGREAFGVIKKRTEFFVTVSFRVYRDDPEPTLMQFDRRGYQRGTRHGDLAAFEVFAVTDKEIEQKNKQDTIDKLCKKIKEDLDYMAAVLFEYDSIPRLKSLRAKVRALRQHFPDTMDFGED